MAVQQIDGNKTTPDVHPSAAAPRRQPGALIPFLFVVFPPLLFYSFLWRTAVNIPFYDDYAAVLSFLNQLGQLHGLLPKVSFFFAAQYNEYKLFFLHALVWLQVALSGKVDFFALSILGDGFVMLLGLLLWKMFLPTHKDLAVRLGLFIPVSWLLFQLQYWETLNWSMAGLQNLPILVFCFGAIYLLVKGTRPAFCGALLSLVLAVASSGNGLILLPVGLLILLLSRSYLRSAAWSFVGLFCIAAYSYQYQVTASEIGKHHSLIHEFHWMVPVYILAFIGSAAHFPVLGGSVVLGVLICTFLALMVHRGYPGRNPLVSYCVLFLLLTSFGVAWLRSTELGVQQATSSRYTIYSALLLIFCWFILVEEFLAHRKITFLNNNLFLAASSIAMIFSLLMDATGAVQIERRRQMLVEAMTAFEHSSLNNPAASPSPALSAGPPSASEAAFHQQARKELVKAMQSGIYQPPE